MRALLLCVLCSLVYCTKLNNYKREVVTDFLKNQSEPTKILSFLCWHKDEIVNLIKGLNRKNIFSANYDPMYKHHIPSSVTPEHQFYLLDMNCGYAENVLKLADRGHLLNYPYRWMILEDCDGADKLKKLNIVLNSRMYAVNMCEV